MIREFNMKTNVSNPATVNQILQSVATTTGNGTVLNVYGKSDVGLQIYGTTTSANIVFEGTVDTDPATTKWIAIPACKYTVDFPMSTSAVISGSAPAEIWVVGVKGLAQFRARVSVIGNGNVSILALGVS